MSRFDKVKIDIQAQNSKDPQAVVDEDVESYGEEEEEEDDMDYGSPNSMLKFQSFRGGASLAHGSGGQ